ncbi:MAG: flagellar basal body-associated FliL family protein [Proteobacteria bacterium]|uniref:flagellar basal body-associated FliL family protein n=1 Tax=Aquabacterium sp. TaxID=1872578 RepID=UPI0035C739D8|nr:flagellar basal body-associated FliL family protein [Pseudomonadota bacterium]
MKNRNLVFALTAVVALLLAALVAGGVLWWRGSAHASPTAQAAAAPSAGGHAASGPATPAAERDGAKYKYVSLEKIIVMLRGKDGEPVSHYLAMDLVFKVREDEEKTVKEHLPLLRSVAVKSLSAYTMDKASLMSIDQFTADINRAFGDRYRHEQRDKPFAEAMISKLIIE